MGEVNTFNILGCLPLSCSSTSTIIAFVVSGVRAHSIVGTCFIWIVSAGADFGEVGASCYVVQLGMDQLVGCAVAVVRVVERNWNGVPVCNCSASSHSRIQVVGLLIVGVGPARDIDGHGAMFLCCHDFAPQGKQQ